MYANPLCGQTAATLTFALYCLAMYPEVMKRLREEILTVVGRERNPTFDELREMKYLRAVINGDCNPSKYRFFRKLTVLYCHRGLETLSTGVSHLVSLKIRAVSYLRVSAHLTRGRRLMLQRCPTKHRAQNLGTFRRARGMHFVQASTYPV